MNTLQIKLLDEHKKVKSLQHIEKTVIEKILKKNKFNVLKTCRELKISRATFYRKYYKIINDNEKIFKKIT